MAENNAEQNRETAAERFRRFARALFAVPKSELNEVREGEPLPPMKRGRKPKPTPEPNDEKPTR